MRRIDLPPPAHISPETLMAEHADLYAHFPPLERLIAVKVALFPVDDNIPVEEDISEVVKRLRLHHDGGSSGMRAEHLRMWHRKAK